MAECAAHVCFWGEKQTLADARRSVPCRVHVGGSWTQFWTQTPEYSVIQVETGCSCCSEERLKNQTPLPIVCKLRRRWTEGRAVLAMEHENTDIANSNVINTESPQFRELRRTLLDLGPICRV